MKFLLDTNVFRELGKDKPNANVAAWLTTINDADMAISALTVREVRKGITKLRAAKRDVADLIEIRALRLFDAFGERVLPITRAVADLWGELLAQSEKHVDDIGLVATARVHELILATRNLKHVSGRGVMLLDTFKSLPKVQS